MSKQSIAKEFARRAKQFHENEKPMDINLWGLFLWSSISARIKAGDIIPNAGYSKENHTIWCKPSRYFYEKYIVPLMSKTLEELNK
jgi:hypothetical protein